jgi:hypothetical protein
VINIDPTEVAAAIANEWPSAGLQRQLAELLALLASEDECEREAAAKALAKLLRSALDDPDELIPLPAVKRLMGGASTSSIYAWEDFPQPISRKGPDERGRWARWVKREVIAYRRKLIEQRDAKAEKRRRELTARHKRRMDKRRQATELRERTAHGSGSMAPTQRGGRACPIGQS